MPEGSLFTFDTAKGVKVQLDKISIPKIALSGGGECEVEILYINIKYIDRIHSKF